MELNPKTINEILDMYVKYCKALKIKDLPPLTLNQEEYMTALIHPLRQKVSKSGLKHALGQTTHKWELDNEFYNYVVFVDASKMVALHGLHDKTEWQRVKKRKYWHKIRYRIGHLEETLIHELVHVAMPELRHGKQFDRIVKNIYLRYNSDNQ